jgi:hypothetical protein
MIVPALILIAPIVFLYGLWIIITSLIRKGDEEKKQELLDELEKGYASGRLTKKEYEKRKKEIINKFEEEYISLGEVENNLQKTNFWLFSGKLAVLGIIFGIIVAWTTNFIIGAIICLASVGYIYFRLKHLNETKK